MNTATTLSPDVIEPYSNFLAKFWNGLTHLIYNIVISLYPAFSFIMQYWLLFLAIAVFFTVFFLIPWTRIPHSQKMVRYIVTSISSIVGAALFLHTISTYGSFVLLSQYLMYNVFGEIFKQGVGNLWVAIFVLLFVAAFFIVGIIILPYLLKAFEYILEIPGMIFSLLVGGSQRLKNTVRFTFSFLIEGGLLLYSIWGNTYAYLYLTGGKDISHNVGVWLFGLITIFILLSAPFLHLLQNFAKMLGINIEERG